MSNDGDRMLTVAELLRREGFEPAGRSHRKRMVTVGAGTVALCGATVTGMLALAPMLSMSLSPPMPADELGAGLGRALGDDVAKTEHAGAEREPVTLRQAAAEVREAAVRPRIPALSQITPDLRPAGHPQGSRPAAEAPDDQMPAGPETTEPAVEPEPRTEQSEPRTAESGESGTSAAESGESGAASEGSGPPQEESSSEPVQTDSEESPEEPAGESAEDPAGEPSDEPDGKPSAGPDDERQEGENPGRGPKGQPTSEDRDGK